MNNDTQDLLGLTLSATKDALNFDSPQDNGLGLFKGTIGSLAVTRNPKQMSNDTQDLLGKLPNTKNLLAKSTLTLRATKDTFNADPQQDGGLGHYKGTIRPLTNLKEQSGYSSIPPGVWSFQDEFVGKRTPVEDHHCVMLIPYPVWPGLV